MNAIESARTLDWRGSAAFDSALLMGDTEPAKVYDFIGRSTFNAGFRKQLAESKQKVFEEFGFGSVAHAASTGDLDRRLGLAEDEIAALNQISLVVRKKGLEGEITAEKAAIQEGYGMPAIAVLVVVVAIALWVVVVSVDQQAF